MKRYRRGRIGKRLKKQMRGSIALFLSMIMLFLVIFEGFLIDGSKLLAARLLMSDAGDLTMNAALTYYDQALMDIYGLFANAKTEADLKDNLQKYFERSLGQVSNVEMGYSDELISAIKNAISEPEEGYSRLLDIQLKDLSYNGLPGSELSNPYVMEDGIIQYMKYRGPASMGYGILEKLKVFKGLKKQQKALEKKLDYEEKLSDVQDVCEKAYKSLKKYRNLVRAASETEEIGSMNPLRVEQRCQEIDHYIEETIKTVWTYAATRQDYGQDPWKVMDGGSSHDVLSAADQCGNLEGLVYQRDQAKKNLDSIDTEPQIEGSMLAIEVALNYRDNLAYYKNLYTNWQNYKKYYEEEKKRIEEAIAELEEAMGEDEDDTYSPEIEELEQELEALEQEYEKNKEVYQDKEKLIDQLPDIIDIAKDRIHQTANDRMGSAVEAAKYLDADIAVLHTYATDSINDLKAILNKLNTLQAAGTEWKNANAALDDGEIKASMTADYENRAKTLNEDAIHILMDKVQKGLDYADKLKPMINAVMAIQTQVLSAVSDYGDHLADKLESGICKNDIRADLSTGDNFDYDLWKENALTTPLLVESGGNVRYAVSYFLETALDELRDDPFFQYLQKTCIQKEEDEGEKKDAKEKKKNLLEQGNEAVPRDPVTTSLSKTEDMPSAASSTSHGFDHPSSDAKDADLKKNANKNNNSTMDLLAGIEQLLESGRNKLYVAEYATEMFSYYTIATDPMKKKGEGFTLGNHEISAENNVLYRAEVEYLLWGDPNGDSNVDHTEAAIFGIRFLLNSLYAFTGDAEIRSTSLALATAIAGWTGFGVPLVQSVIILAFALAETTYDLTQLMGGHDVPIYKSQNTWVVKPSGLTKEMLSVAVHSTATVGKEALCDKLNELTAETKDQFRGTLTEYKKNAVDNLVAAASASILNPLQDSALVLVNTIVPSDQQISAMVDQAIEGISAQIVTGQDTVLEQLKLEAVQVVKTTYAPQLVSILQGWYQDTRSAVARGTDLEEYVSANNKGLTDKIKTYFSDTEKSLKSFLDQKASGLVESACSTVDSALDSGNEYLQENVSKAMDEMVAKIDGGIADASLPEYGNTTGRAGIADMITMNYKEYLKVFIAVQCIADEDKILTRIGDLIQANLTQSAAKPSPDFKIKQAATLVELRATADLKTTFFSLPIPNKDGGRAALGKDSYSVSYHGVLAY